MHTSKYIVAYKDCYPNGNIRPTELIKYIQESAMEQMVSKKPSYDDLFNSGMAFVISKLNIIVRDKITQSEEITVNTWPTEATTGFTSIRSYNVILNGKVVMEGTGVWALIDVNTRSLLKINSVDLSNYGYAPPLESTLKKRVMIPKDGLSVVGSHTVTYSQCDLNMHLTNSNYGDILADFVPNIACGYITEMNLHFKAEAPLHSILTIKYCEIVNADNSVSHIVVSYLHDNSINAVAEFKLAKIIF